jgi:hypothetical protein
MANKKGADTLRYRLLAFIIVLNVLLLLHETLRHHTLLGTDTHEVHA